MTDTLNHPDNNNVASGAVSSCAGGLDFKVAYRLMQLSAAAYTDTPDVRDDQTDTNVRIVEDADLDAYVIAFRGSSSLLNFLTDAKAWRVARVIAGRDVQIHAGFDEAISRVQDAIKAKISPFLDRKLYVCGHSLGGALAVLCMLKIRECDGCYTFGQPRVGNAAFAALCQSQFGDRHFRFEDEEDIVTRIPGWLAGYRHSGQNIFMPTIGGYKLNAPLWFKALSDAWGIYRARAKGPLALNELILCHHETRYLNKLSALAA